MRVHWRRRFGGLSGGGVMLEIEKGRVCDAVDRSHELFDIREVYV